MKILIINKKEAGDVLFSTPLLRALKLQLEDAHIYYLTGKPGVIVFGENPYVDTVIVWGSVLETRKKIKALAPDVTIDLQNNIETRLITFLVSGKIYRLSSLWLARWLLVNFKINKFSNEHIVERVFSVAAPLHVKKDDWGLDYIIPEKDEVPSDWLPKGFQKDYVVFCISSPYATRKLPVKRMIELCDKINKPIILLGDKDDFATAESINTFFNRNENDMEWEEGLKALNKKTIVFNACGKFSLHQMASVVKNANYVFTFDNDFVAIASAFKKIVFVVMGNTSLLFGRYPYNTRFIVLENNRVACRPCSSQGYNKCPKSHFKCMNDIVFDFYLP